LLIIIESWGSFTSYLLFFIFFSNLFFVGSFGFFVLSTSIAKRINLVNSGF